jgi:hypothetical protein
MKPNQEMDPLRRVMGERSRQNKAVKTSMHNTSFAWLQGPDVVGVGFGKIQSS